MASISMEIKYSNVSSFMKNIIQADGTSVEWGIFKDAGIHPKADMPVANLQAIHEFRQDGWRRPLFHIQAEKIKDGHLHKKIRFEMKRFVDQLASGGRTPISYYLSNLGVEFTKDMVSMYGRKGISYKGMTIPANTQRTKEIKGHDRPLLELGVLKKSVRFTTNKKGG